MEQVLTCSRDGPCIHEYDCDPYRCEPMTAISVGPRGTGTATVPRGVVRLAGKRTILNLYSSMIEHYRDADLVPPIAHRVHDLYYADKVSFVGFTPGDEEAWQTALMCLNAALGRELEGDLHLVVAQDPTVFSNPDAYMLILAQRGSFSSIGASHLLG